MRHVTEIRQQTFEMSPAPLRLLVTWTTRLNENRDRWQHAFVIAQRDDHGRRLCGKDVIGKTRRNRQVAQGRARRHPAHKQRRTEERKDKKQQVVSRVPRRKPDDDDDHQKHAATTCRLERKIKIRDFHSCRTRQRRHDKDRQQQRNDERQDRSCACETTLIGATCENRYERGRESGKNEQRPQNNTRHRGFLRSQSCAVWLHNGTLTVFRISLRTASASSLRRSDDENRELTVMRCAKTGITSRLMSSGMQ